MQLCLHAQILAQSGEKFQAATGVSSRVRAFFGSLRDRVVLLCIPNASRLTWVTRVAGFDAPTPDKRIWTWR